MTAPNNVQYTVNPGDSLTSIALDHGVNPADLLESNPQIHCNSNKPTCTDSGGFIRTEDGSHIYVGEVLTIPSESATTETTVVEKHISEPSTTSVDGCKKYDLGNKDVYICKGVDVEEKNKELIRTRGRGLDCHIQVLRDFKVYTDKTNIRTGGYNSESNWVIRDINLRSIDDLVLNCEIKK